MLKSFLKNRILNSRTTTGTEGFTLLEVIIAMAIMAVAFSAILAVEGGAINASARAKQLNVVAMLAKNQMIDTEYVIEGKKFEEVEKEKSGTFDAPYQEYRWKRTIKEMKFPNLAGGKGKKPDQGNAGSSATGGNNRQTELGDMVGKLITNFFSKAMREVTITVTWTRGKGEQSYSVSTYWVDLNHEFKITE